MLKKKPSETLAGLRAADWTIDVAVILDELHARLSALESPAVKGGEVDAVEMLREYRSHTHHESIGFRELSAIIAAIEADRVEHLVDYNRALDAANLAESALAAEKRAHEETKVSCEGWRSTAKDLADKSDRFAAAMGKLAMTLDSMPGITWAGVLGQCDAPSWPKRRGSGTVTSLTAARLATNATSWCAPPVSMCDQTTMVRLLS
jgi:hypothetical protein